MSGPVVETCEISGRWASGTHDSAGPSARPAGAEVAQPVALGVALVQRVFAERGRFPELLPPPPLFAPSSASALAVAFAGGLPRAARCRARRRSRRARNGALARALVALRSARTRTRSAFSEDASRTSLTWRCASGCLA